MHLCQTTRPITKFGTITIYCKECYSIGFYYCFFITMTLGDVSMICRNMYNMIYATEVLKISTGSFGEIMGWYGAVGALLSLPRGYIYVINLMR